MYIKFQHVFITCVSAITFAGCLNTEGKLDIKGSVVDEQTKVQIPGRNIIVQGLVKIENELFPVEAGQFSTDSSGSFTYTLRKIKDAYYYNFCLVGDSSYSFMTRKFSLSELQQNAKYLFFSLNKLVDLRIRIYRKSNSPYCDTLYLSWESNGIDFKVLYPYKIENYRMQDNFSGLSSYSGLGLVWIGENTNSAIRTRVFADKMTRLHWELVRNKERKEITDTITCKRDIINTVYFTY
jgi:hypothetical protein